MHFSNSHLREDLANLVIYAFFCLGMVRNNKLSGIIIGSVLLLYNRVAIIMCINKHKYIRDSCITKLTDHLEIGLKQNKTTESMYYASYIFIKIESTRVAA